MDENALYPDSIPVQLASLTVSLSRLDGGGLRVRAFLDCLDREGCVVKTLGLGPSSSAAMDKLVDSRVHRLKRRMFPVAFRRKVHDSLPGPSEGCAVSLIPIANQWAVKSRRSWLDFPDLNSEMAKNHARTVDPLSALVNLAQAQLWASREAEERRRATVTSTASWSDAERLGKTSVWMPTPVMDTSKLRERRSRPASQEQPTYGMLANFHYPPNKDAYFRLTREWLGLLCEGGGSVLVAGFGSENLPRDPRVRVLGPVASVSEFYESVDIALSPVQRGGGMKVKVVEAMMHGVSVLATDHSLEGLPPIIGEACFRWPDAKSAPQDPRARNDVFAELESFTVESFQQKFDTLWRTRIMN